jgi:hypothetical protein
VQTNTGSGGGPADRGARALRTGFLLAILFLATGYTYVAFAELSYLTSAGRLGPGFMPRIIGVALVAMCVLSLAIDLKRQPAGEALLDGWRSAAALAALSGVFIVLLELLGGLLSMVAFMAASLWLLNPRRHLQNALIAVLLPVFLYVVFAVWLRASMPRGLLPLPF